MRKQLTQQPADMPKACAGQHRLLQHPKQGIHTLPRCLCMLFNLLFTPHSIMPICRWCILLMLLLQRLSEAIASVCGTWGMLPLIWRVRPLVMLGA